jgi:hypothetical protein
MSGLREKIADAIAGAVSQDDRYLEHADAVLRVLAEHGDTQQLAIDSLTNELEAANADCRNQRRSAERAEADLAAARQQLDQVRELVDDLTDPDGCYYDHHGYCQAHGWMETDPACPQLRAKLWLHPIDAPARPAGHDKSGQ